MLNTCLFRKPSEKQSLSYLLVILKNNGILIFKNLNDKSDVHLKKTMLFVVRS